MLKFIFLEYAEETLYKKLRFAKVGFCDSLRVQGRSAEKAKCININCCAWEERPQWWTFLGEHPVFLARSKGIIQHLEPIYKPTQGVSK